MSRKFSDSEIRAYSKNRFEERLLRRRLDKLKESVGVFHDASAKQKQELVDECKGIRMTTGGSYVPEDVDIDDDFDISKRVSRPWAYSVMETTYNVVYRDAVIPVPRKRSSKTRIKSGTPRTLLSRSSIESNRIPSSKSQTSLKSCLTTRSEGALQQSEVPAVQRSVSFPEINELKTHKHKQPETMVNEGRENGNIDSKSDAIPENNLENINESHLGNTSDKVNISLNNETDKGGVQTNDSIAIGTGQSTDTEEASEALGNIYKPLREYMPVTKIITLPAVYKIDSKSYQEAERQRTISRSRSRVSFSDVIGTNDPNTQSRHKPKSANEISKPSINETGTNETDVSGSHQLDTDRKEEISRDSNRNDVTTSSTVLTVDPETIQDIRTRKPEDITYRGRRLRNYIRPEDRYKLDPLIMKRRQNKMDKLAKESVSFLKRVNHENIRVEIAFPRSARRRILTKLVQENNTGRTKVVSDNNAPQIQKKVEYFMNSISEYIYQQQMDRDMCYM